MWNRFPEIEKSTLEALATPRSVPTPRTSKMKLA